MEVRAQKPEQASIYEECLSEWRSLMPGKGALQSGSPCHPRGKSEGEDHEGMKMMLRPRVGFVAA